MEFWFSEFHTPDVKHSIRVSRQLYSKQLKRFPSVLPHG